jgi:hypothetical protein
MVVLDKKLRLICKLDILVNAFCPTGDGGGQDNSCGGGNGTDKFLQDWSLDPAVFVEYRHWAMTGSGQTQDDAFSEDIDRKLDDIAASDPTCKSNKLYRGEVGLTQDQVSKMQPGELLERPGWYSSTSDREVAENFTDLKDAEDFAGQDLPGKERVLFEIYGVKGHRVVDLRKHGVNLDQSEVLLPGKGTYLRVLFVEDTKKGYKKVVAQIEPNRKK